MHSKKKVRTRSKECNVVIKRLVYSFRYKKLGKIGSKKALKKSCTYLKKMGKCLKMDERLRNWARAEKK